MTVGARYSFWEFSRKYNQLWRKKIHHVCCLIIGYLWAKYKDFEFWSMCHILLISCGLQGHSLLTLPATRRKYSLRASCSLWFFIFSLTLLTFCCSKLRIFSSILFMISWASIKSCNKLRLFLASSSLASAKMEKAWRKETDQCT